MEASLFHGNLVKSDRILYTPSVFARTNLIHLQEIGSLAAQKPHTSKREHLCSYLCFIVCKGSGILEYENTSHKLTAGDCVFLDCQKPYSHRTSEHLWNLKWVHFYGSNMSGIYQKYTERGGTPCFHAKNFAAFDKNLSQIYEAASSDAYIRDMKICEKLTELLTLLMEESWNPKFHAHSSPGKRSLSAVKEYLDLHYAEKISLDDLSELFYLNKFYLTRIFKDQFGMPIHSYLLSVRITHAKQLLRFSDLSMEEISHECGMNDANYFSRAFKKIERMTPGEYRRSW